MPIPIIIWGVISGATLLGAGYSLFNLSKKKIYISALGPVSSGKTTFHNYLRKTKFEDGTIGHNDLKEIKIEIKDKKITLSKGKDISGTEQAVKAYYKDEINKSDLIFYFLDSKKMLVDKSYVEVNIGRLNFINKINKERHKNNRAKVIIIASHYDSVSHINNARQKVWQKIEKIASEGGIQAPHFINLTDSSQLEKLKIKLFEDEK
ncbi:hypothetical protein [Chondrinema litorale]|uniref:hypothetical protein n=1 Tax=Chondrinema litorale TaxID=2994555 RepID=UPI00254318EC|nr:hypothetical protein [Chondrinema litorale]UZR99850.1 hypothetical protein OQ292_38335 [Chondrinema litorale]